MNTLSYKTSKVVKCKIIFMPSMIRLSNLNEWKKGILFEWFSGMGSLKFKKLEKKSSFPDVLHSWTTTSGSGMSHGDKVE